MAIKCLLLILFLQMYFHREIVAQVLIESQGNGTNGTVCTDEQFDCGDGTCLSLAQECDTVYDCMSGADEADCADYYGCTDDLFDCGDDVCIEEHQRCDGIQDCDDGLDEMNCTTQTVTVTTTAKVVESTTATTIGSQDYTDYPDYVQCGDSEYGCLDELCIDKTQVCDGNNDCISGEDEENCEFPTTSSIITKMLTHANTAETTNKTTLKDDTSSSILVTISSNSAPTSEAAVGCTYQDQWYTAGTDIAYGICTTTVCSANGTVVEVKLDTPGCAACLNAKINGLLIFAVVLIGILFNER